MGENYSCFPLKGQALPKLLDKVCYLTKALHQCNSSGVEYHTFCVIQRENASSALGKTLQIR